MTTINTNKIIIKNTPIDLDEEFFVLILSTKKYGELKISEYKEVNVNRLTDSKDVILTFQNVEDARNFLRESPIKICKFILTLELYEDNSDSSVYNQNYETVGFLSRFTKTRNQTEAKSFNTNTPENVSIKPKQYKTLTDSDDDYDKRRFKLVIYTTKDSNHNFNVESPKINSIVSHLVDNCRFKIEDIDYNTKFGITENYGINNNQDNVVILNVLLIVCENDVDFERIEKLCSRLNCTLYGKSIKYFRLKHTKSIIASGHSNEDECFRYFSNRNMSNGGLINKIVSIGTPQKSCFIIEFENKECAERVIEIYHENYNVYPFYGDINKVQSNRIHISIKDYPYNIIIRNDLIKAHFETLLRKSNAVIESIKNDELIVRTDMKSKINVLKDAIKAYENNFESHEWSNNATLIKEELSEVYETKRLPLNIEFIKESNGCMLTVRIDGPRNIVRTEIPNIDAIIKNVCNLKIDDEISGLKMYECNILLLESFIANCKVLYDDIILKVIANKGLVKFSGTFTSVFNAKQLMWNIINSIKHKDFNIDYNIANFLVSSFDYVHSCLHKNKINSVIEIIFNTNNSTNLIVYSCDEANFNKTMKFITNNFKQFIYPITKESVELIDTVYNKKFLLTLKEELKLSNEQDRVLFIEDKHKKFVGCVGESLVVNRLSDLIIDFFEANMLVTEECNLNREDIQFLKIVKKTDLNNICNELRSKCILTANYEFEITNENEYKLKLTLTKRGIEQMKRKIQYLLQNSKIIDYLELQNHDIFNTRSGVYNIKAIESEHRCMIVNCNQAKNTQNIENLVFQSLYSIKTNNFKIFVVKSTIDTIKHAQSIVLSSNFCLKPTTNSSTILFSKAGESIIDECRNILLKERNITFEGDAFITPAGDLEYCRALIHTIIPKDIQRSDNAIIYLSQSIYNCLNLANKHNLSSIAFPLFYSEDCSVNYISDKILPSIFKTVVKYFEDNQDENNVKEIHIVDNLLSNVVVDYLKVNFDCYKNNEFDSKLIKVSKISNRCKINVEITIGSIVDRKYKTDVIVNSTASNLQLSYGSLSKMIVKEAGYEIQRELNSKYPSGLDNQTTYVAISSAGKIKNAKYIFHVGLPEWNNDSQNKNEKIFRKILQVILENAEKLNCETILLPAIGTGVLKYPKDLVPQWIYTTIDNYCCKKLKSTTIKKVVIVLHEKDTLIIDSFKNYEKIFKANIENKTVESTCPLKRSNSINKIRFKLVSDQRFRIEDTKKAIKQLIDDNIKTHEIRNEYLIHLNQSEIDEIESCLDSLCEYKIEQDLCIIKISGSLKIINDCIPLVHDLICKFRQNHINNAQHIGKNVQWQYHDNTKWVSYNILVNYQLEKAFKSNSQSCEYINDDNELKYVDFVKRIEFTKFDGSTKYNIRRCDLSNLEKLSIPSNWTSNSSCELVILNKYSEEYKQVRRLFPEDGEYRLNSWLKRIVSIQRIENLHLYMQYMIHKSYFEEKNSNFVNEKILFHGTTEDAIEKIWKTGFNRRYSGRNGSAYGKGVYFAKDPICSHYYTNLAISRKSPLSTNYQLFGHIFVCKVLVGVSALGNNKIEIDNLPKQNGCIADTTVDDVNNPKIFVTYNDCQAYPEYLVTYE